MNRLRKHQILVFFLTFWSYAFFCASRITYSVTKPLLHGDDDYPGWAPFNQDDGKSLLGLLDSVFLIGYAIGLFCSGHLGDQLNLRYFLVFGMVASGLAVAVFGCAEYLNIHSMVYFGLSNFSAGLLQSIGWPANVTLMARWFPASLWGTVMGVWCAQASVGMIVGKFYDAVIIRQVGWGAVFVVNGAVSIAMGGVLLLFLNPRPEDVLDPSERVELLKNTDVIPPADAHLAAVGHAASEDPQDRADSTQAYVDMDLPVSARKPQQYEHISFKRAIMLPGVIPFAISLFFCKLVAYAFVFWLPDFLSQWYDASTATNMSTVYDVGSIIGGIFAGLLVDYTKKPGLVCAVMLVLCVGCLWLFNVVASTDWNMPVLFFVGVFVSGPYVLMASAISADLATHPSLEGNPTAMGTVTGFIDGCGTLGSVVQGLGVGLMVDMLNWSSVFLCLMVASLCSAFALFSIVRGEILELCGNGDVKFTKLDDREESGMHENQGKPLQ